MLNVPGTQLTKHVQPGTMLRPDVGARYPQYSGATPGWQAELDIGNCDLATGSIVQVTYVKHGLVRRHERPIVFKDPKSDTSSGEHPIQLTIEELEFSPLRGIMKLKARVTGDEATSCAFNATWSVISEKGMLVQHPDLTVNVEKKPNHLRVEARFKVTGLASGDTFRLACDKDGTTLSQAVHAKEQNDSERRAAALTSSRIPDYWETSDFVSIKDLINLRQNLALQDRKVVPGSVCFFPGFETPDELSNQYHRASWYLGGTGTHVKSVTFFNSFACTQDDILPPSDGFALEGLEPGTGFQLLDREEDYSRALNEAALILVWKTISKENHDYLKKRFPGAQVLTVATNDPTAAEYGNWAKAPWALLKAEDRKALLAESHERFKKVLELARDQGKTCAAVLGTGPSLDRAIEYDFSDALSVACNTIVASDSLLDHVQPTFVTSGDAVSHFGVSQYAARYRRDLIRCLTTRNTWFLTTAAMGYVLAMRHPEIAHRMILCDQNYSGINTDLEQVWSLPRFDSTLNIHMLPVAATFADTIFMIGFDGKNPNPEANEDFWAHSKEAHYHDLVETGHACHPTFSINRAQSTAERFLASVEESFAFGEMLGKRFLSLEPSFTPAIHARQVPKEWFQKVSKNGAPRIAPAPLSAAKPGSRALVIMTSPRVHFSGGRYHATFLALGLANFCEEVVVWGNNCPPWMSELALFPAFPRLRFLPNDFTAEPDGEFDIVVFVPQLPKVAYIKGYKIARRDGAKTAFLSFESPNWFNSMSPAPRPASDFNGWYAGACFADRVLCSAETAVPFAEEFHAGPFGSPKFSVAPPAINDAVVGIVKATPMERINQIIVFGRFGASSAHKNLTAMFDVLPSGLEGWTIALVAGTSNKIDDSELDELMLAARARGMDLKFLNMISDRAKYEEIAKSRLMLFPSVFEGFGYPPVEAAHMGTPCVMYDLPVLKEFNSDHGHFVPTGDAEAMREKIREVLAAPPHIGETAETAAICARTTVEAFSETLYDIFKSEEDWGRAANFSEEKYQSAITYYEERARKQRYRFASFSIEDLHRLCELYADDIAVYEDALRALRARGVCACKP